METPKDRKYGKEHEWVKIEDDVATIGITDHAQENLTDIVFVELPEEGDEIEIGQPFCVIESVKSVSDVFAPVKGEVIEVNEELEENPENLNESPYEKGWIAKVKVSEESKDLMSAEEYEDFIAEN